MVGKKVLIPAAGTLVAAIIIAGGNVTARHSRADPGNAVTVGPVGGNACGAVAGSNNQVNCPEPSSSRGQTRTDENPSGSGPWAFYVEGTVVDGTDQGLWVRACNEQTCGCDQRNCEKRGMALQGTVLYAQCQARSTFNGNDSGPPVWLRIQWPSNTPGDIGHHVSDPHDKYAGWVLRKYTSPGGHNGDIPSCT